MAELSTPASAVDVARFVVKYCQNIGKPISNLKLQKLLYFVWIEYYKETKSFLFYDKFYAWKFGPVIPEAYYKYSFYGGIPIVLFYDEEPEEKNDVTNIIEKSLDKYLAYTARQLVEMTHRTGTPWARLYSQNNKNTVIPFDQIIDFECSLVYCGKRKRN